MARRMKETIRRVYRDLVVRRSTVRVVDAVPSPPLRYPPVFIVGAYRSGTTLLRYVIDSHSHLCCPAETYFIELLRRLVDGPGYRAGLASMGFEREHVVKRLRELCIYFFENYAVSCSKRRWADKSPGCVDYLGFLRELFPEAQFVMIYRHGLDQAHSLVRAGFLRRTLAGYRREGEDLRLAALRYWREKVERMMQYEAQNPDQCVRIRYEDLCLAPEAELRRVFAFLGEPWEPQVLHFDRFPHDRGYEDERVAATHGFSISAGHYRQWPPELYAEGHKLAAGALQRLGYPVDQEP